MKIDIADVLGVRIGGITKDLYLRLKVGAGAAGDIGDGIFVGHLSMVHYILETGGGGIVDGEPDIVVVGVLDGDLVGEEFIGRFDAGDRLQHVQVALTVVGSGQGADASIGLIVVTAEHEIGAVGIGLGNRMSGRLGSGFRSNEVRIVILNLYQHGDRTVDHHGMYGGGVQLPGVFHFLGLGEAEIVAFGALHDRNSAGLDLALRIGFRFHDTDGNERRG